MCVDTTNVADTERCAKRVHKAAKQSLNVVEEGKQSMKVVEEDVPDMPVPPILKLVDVCKVDKTPPTTAIEDEEVVVVDLHSMEKSESKSIDQPLEDEDEADPKFPTQVERMTRARAKKVAEEVPPLQLQKKKAAQVKRKVGGAAKKTRK